MGDSDEVSKEGDTSPEPGEFNEVHVDEIVFTGKVRVWRMV